MRKLQKDELPESLQNKLFEAHTHAELVDGEEIVYREQDVLDIIKYVSDMEITTREGLELCTHAHILFVEATPTDGKFFEDPYRYIECKDCGDKLGIASIENVQRTVPLTPDIDD